MGSHGTPAGLDSGMEMSPRLCHKEEGFAPVDLLREVFRRRNSVIHGHSHSTHISGFAYVLTPSRPVHGGVQNQGNLCLNYGGAVGWGGGGPLFVYPLHGLLPPPLPALTLFFTYIAPFKS